MKKEKIKITKILIITIMALIMLLILPKKALAAKPSFETIDGTTITTDSSERAAVNFYNTLKNYNDSNQLPIPLGENENDTYFNWIGKQMGMFSWAPSTYKFAFSTYLRNIDSPTSGDKTTTSVCFEPGKDNTADNGVVDSGKNYYIGQILVIDKENVYLYQKDSGTKKVFHCTTDEVNNTYNWQKTLHWAYQAQSNPTAAYNFAKYITSTTKWKEDTQKVLGRDIINTNYNREYETLWRTKDKKHNYRGVFVWFFADNDSGQGTMFWHVTRESPTPEVDLKIRKVDQDENYLSGATLYVNANYAGSNVKTMFQDENKIQEKNTQVSDGCSWDITIVPDDATKPVKLKISETEAPENYTGIDGEYEITISYDSEGKITKIEKYRERLRRCIRRCKSWR